MTQPLYPEDTKYMLRALELAKLGEGNVEPNPMVGCVIVRDGHILGEGFHRRFGGPHAEREAIADAMGKNISDLSGSTAYVTLEPCCHHGKTPPCTDAILEHRFARVVCASADPFAQVSGRGIDLLRSRGVEVQVGLCEIEATELNAPYLKRLRAGMPWVIGKWAMSLDGKIATRTGHSRWISGQESRAMAHAIRGRMDAILVGRGTVEADDPLLTCRPAGKRVPIRVVLDSELSISLDSKLVQTASETPVLIYAGPEASADKSIALKDKGCLVVVGQSSSRNERITELLRYLTVNYSATNVLVEGGAELLGSMFDLRLIDECAVFAAPKLIGGRGAPSPISGLGIEQVGMGPTLKICQREQLGDDQFWRARLRWSCNV